MSNRLYLLIALVGGIVTGFFTIHSIFAQSWTSMILWVAVGLALLSYGKDRTSGLYAGAVFGFCTIFSWLLSGFQGTSDQLGGFLILTFGLSVLGALSGAIGAVIFFWIKKKMCRA